MKLISKVDNSGVTITPTSITTREIRVVVVLRKERSAFCGKRRNVQRISLNHLCTVIISSRDVYPSKLLDKYILAVKAYKNPPLKSQDHPG